MNNGIRYENPTERSLASVRVRQVSDDFNSARRRALISGLKAKIKGQRDCLLSFDEVRVFVRVHSKGDCELKRVSLDRIMGTENGSQDFSHDFLPRKHSLRAQWQSVDLAFYEDATLPPVKLFEIGGVFFVREGEHVISVARARNRALVDAEVIHLQTDVVLQPDMSIRHIKELAAITAKEAHRKSA